MLGIKSELPGGRKNEKISGNNRLGNVFVVRAGGCAGV